ncbi:MAG: DUF4386 domain-containing protein [Hyphomonadaceae bacterium]|nr:DUF4386 domain-containing protein [Hyphomonadaceae bacterium]
MAEQVLTEAPRPFAGAAAIAVAIGFNVPFAILGATFDYPDVLRRPAGDVLDLFAQGGAPLILTWHAFALSALALVPLAFALTLTRKRVADAPGLAIGAAIAGALSALAQAIGLWRWVFVVPGLARVHSDAAAGDEAKRAAERTFDLINQYGGIAIGEHLGQLLLAIFVVCLGALQLRERKFVTGGLALLTATAIVVGTGEGLMLALGQSGEGFALVTIGGFVGLTLWLIATGIGTMRGAR